MVFKLRIGQNKYELTHAEDETVLARTGETLTIETFEDVQLFETRMSDGRRRIELLREVLDRRETWTHEGPSGFAAYAVRWEYRAFSQNTPDDVVRVMQCALRLQMDRVAEACLYVIATKFHMSPPNESVAKIENPFGVGVRPPTMAEAVLMRGR
jgi:hypothetical protein